jgi:hypothetical protein
MTTCIVVATFSTGTNMDDVFAEAAARHGIELLGPPPRASISPR